MGLTPFPSQQATIARLPQIKSSLFARTCIFCGPVAMKRNLYLFPKGEGL
jgi:hypothetical protein